MKFEKSLKNQEEIHEKNMRRQQSVVNDLLIQQQNEREDHQRIQHDMHQELQHTHSQWHVLENELETANSRITEMEQARSVQVDSKCAQHNEGHRIENDSLKLEIENIQEEHGRNVNKYNALAIEFNERGAVLRQQKKMIEKISERKFETSQRQFERNIQNMENKIPVTNHHAVKCKSCKTQMLNRNLTASLTFRETKMPEINHHKMKHKTCWLFTKLSASSRLKQLKRR